MKVKIYTSYGAEAYNVCLNIVTNAGHTITDKNPDILICPDFDELLPIDVIKAAKYGALVFHPSPLPRMRGRDAIKRQYKAGDVLGGGTWFWAGNGIDDGDICEQEVCKINPCVRPRDYYKNLVLPIMADSLKRALSGIESGNIRKIKQRV